MLSTILMEEEKRKLHRGHHPGKCKHCFVLSSSSIHRRRLHSYSPKRGRSTTSTVNNNNSGNIVVCSLTSLWSQLEIYAGWIWLVCFGGKAQQVFKLIKQPRRRKNAFVHTEFALRMFSLIFVLFEMAK